MKVAPAVAAVPAALMMAMLIAKVRIVAAGIKRPPSFFKGLATAATRCLSQPLADTAAAKPIAAQMAGTSVTFVMPFTKAWKAFIGSPAAMHITKPAMRSSIRVS